MERNHKTRVYLDIAPKLRGQALVEFLRIHSSVFLLDEIPLHRVPVAENVDNCCSVTAKPCNNNQKSKNCYAEMHISSQCDILNIIFFIFLI